MLIDALLTGFCLDMFMLCLCQLHGQVSLMTNCHQGLFNQAGLFERENYEVQQCNQGLFGGNLILIVIYRVMTGILI
jgi:hypothetical protein